MWEKGDIYSRVGRFAGGWGCRGEGQAVRARARSPSIRPRSRRTLRTLTPARIHPRLNIMMIVRAPIETGPDLRTFINGLGIIGDKVG